MEGVPFFPEKPEDEEDDDDSSLEKDTKKTSRPSLFELLQKQEDKDEKEEKKSFELFKDDKEKPEPPLEELGEDEKKFAAEEFVDARQEDLAGENPDVEDVADLALLETIKEKLENDEPVTEEMLDDAVAETMEDLGLEEEPDDNVEAEPDEPEDNDDVTVPLAGAGGGTGGTGTPPPTNNGTGTPPPPPPIPPMPPITGGAGGMPPVIPGPNFNAVPPTPNIAPNQQPDQDQEQDRHSHVPYVLAGGIVGYLIGRRRGRIKAEKRLKPIQEKLEKQVTDLHAQIAERETKIRKLTREKQIPQHVLVEKLEKRRQEKKMEQKAPERLGKIVMGPEAVQIKPEQLKPVELMSVAEMLVVANGISAEQSTVKKLYEMGRLNETGLRRILKAYLAGERIDHVLHEALGRQTSPELMSAHETLQNQPVNQQQAPAFMPVQDTHTDEIRQRLQEANAGTSAPFAQWTEPAKTKPAKSGPSTQTKMIASIAVGVVIALLFVLLVLQ